VAKTVKSASMLQPYLPKVSQALNLLHQLGAEESLCSPRRVDKPLILYGAGDMGRMACDFFQRINIPFLYVVDAAPQRYKDSGEWDGVSLLKPSAVPAGHRAETLLAICISTVSYERVIQPLIAQGWEDIVHFYDIAQAYQEHYPLGNGWFTGDLSPDDMVGIERVLKRWEDDVSRAHHLQFIAWHRLRKELIFNGAPVTLEDRFFIPQVISALRRDEVFLDGGAYHGEVSLRFMNLVKNEFSKVYAIEPDRYSVNVLRDRLSGDNGLTSGNVPIMECALGSSSGVRAFFHGLGYASQLSTTAQETVSVSTLDELDIPATFIKLHLEGWELEALRGGMQSIRLYRPVLALTTYHQRNGLWDVQDFLMRELQDYVFFLRLHSWVGTGCVVYAIPRERYLP